MRCAAILGAVVAATFFAGCSSTETKTATNNDDKVYVTGSRLPRSSASTVTATEDKNQIHDAMRPQPATGGTSGH